MLGLRGLPFLFPRLRLVKSSGGGFFPVGVLDGRRPVGGWKGQHGLVDGGVVFDLLSIL